jgi:hypothetical protein
MPTSIPLTLAELIKDKNYPRRLSKSGSFGGKLDHKVLREFMSHTPGTPCCVQVCHAFNMAQHPITPQFTGMRPNRGPSPIKIDGRVYYYLLAVDEMEAWLTSTYGAGEELRGPGVGPRSAVQIKQAIKNRPGLLTMWGKPERWHTEFWDGSRYVQPDIGDGILENPWIRFWDLTLAPPAWLTSYMAKKP